MNSKMGWMLAKKGQNGLVLYPGKSFARELDDALVDPSALPTYVQTPDSAKLEPLATDFVWPSYEAAMRSDGEIASDGIGIRVQAFFSDGPHHLRPEGHFVADEVVALVAMTPHVAADYFAAVGGSRA